MGVAVSYEQACLHAATAAVTGYWDWAVYKQQAASVQQVL